MILRPLIFLWVAVFFMFRFFLLVHCVTVMFVYQAAIRCATADDKTGVDASNEDDPNVKLTAGTWKDVEALVAMSSGKIVVVDIWSTSCLPCITEFPHLVEMQKTHGDKVVCISLRNMGTPQNWK